MGTRLQGGAMPYSGGPVSANTVVPWPVQPKPEPKTHPEPKTPEKPNSDATPREFRAAIQGRGEQGSGQNQTGLKEQGESALGRFTGPKDEVELPKNPGAGQRDRTEAFLARSRDRNAPHLGEKSALITSGDEDLSAQLRSNLMRSRLEHSQRRPGLGALR